MFIRKIPLTFDIFLIASNDVLIILISNFIWCRDGTGINGNYLVHGQHCWITRWPIDRARDGRTNASFRPQTFWRNCALSPFGSIHLPPTNHHNDVRRNSNYCIRLRFESSCEHGDDYFVSDILRNIPLMLVVYMYTQKKKKHRCKTNRFFAPLKI